MRFDRTPSRFPRHLLLPFGALALLLSAGCVERKFLVKSSPSGALIYLDGVEQGRTPKEIKFSFYGTRIFEAEIPDYVRVKQVVEVAPPYYQVFPLDFFFECLWPGHLVHEVPVEFILDPRTKAGEKEVGSLQERAAKFRDQVGQDEAAYQQEK